MEIPAHFLYDITQAPITPHRRIFHRPSIPGFSGVLRQDGIIRGGLKMEKKNARKRVTFQLDAPGAGNVCVAGSFNDWDTLSLPLKQAAGGEDRRWQRIMYLEPGIYQYRFVVDGSWRDDPLCPGRVENEFGSCNSVLRVEAPAPGGSKRKTQK
jgi:hypothetical protein